MISDTLLIAGMVTGFLTVTTGSLVVMGGLYFITAMKQEQLNIRENLRTQKALAQLQFNSGGNEGGEPDLMSLVAQFAPLLMQRQQQPQQQPQKQESDINGKTL